MKRPPFYIVIVFIILCGCHQGEKKLQQEFKNPPATFRMNQILHQLPPGSSEQDSLINAYIQAGYGGFTINTPYRQYLTPEGFETVILFGKKAFEAGLELWLYDEHGYPSGNAGGRVIEKNPEWEGMGLFKKDTLIETGVVRFLLPPGKIDYIKAIQVKGGALHVESITDLSQYIKHQHLHWEAPAGQWKILAVSKYRLYEYFQASHPYKSGDWPAYPSLLIPEVTQTFINLTHDAYAAYLGNDLGRFFFSTFTDEPSLQAVPYARHPWAVIPWHKVVSETVFSLYGYRPEDRYFELFMDPGSEGQKTRYQYFRTVSELMAKNYFGQIKEWCEAHDILSGGHLLLEESMMAHVPLYGDAMACFREMHAPGIDILSAFPENTPVHAPKLASSAAELMGHSRVMSEPCPVQDRRLLDGKEPPAWKVRGHLNILIQGGVTDFNNYLQLSNSTEEEKIEINTYVGRIAMRMRGGHLAANIGLLYPIESLWTRFMPEPQRIANWDSIAGGHPDAIAIEQTFRNTARHLYTNQREYIILDSRAISDSKVQKGRMKHEKLSFDIIILPSVSTLTDEAWDNLYSFVKNGGKLLAINKLPENSSASFPNQVLKDQFQDLFEYDDNAVFLDHFDVDRIETVLGSWTNKIITSEENISPLRIAHRIINDKHIVFLTNHSEETIARKISFNIPGQLREWDPDTGEIKKINNNQEIELRPYHGKIYTGG